MRPGPLRHCVHLIALCLFATGCGRGARTVDPQLIRSDPDAAAREAAREGDWRLVETRAPQGLALEGVRCSIGLDRWSRAARPLSIVLHDVAEPGYVTSPDDPSERRAAARFNALLVAHPQSPYRPFCRDGGMTVNTGESRLDLLGGGPRNVMPWEVLNPQPPQDDLLAAARAGQRDRTAILPLDDALEPDFLGHSALYWAVLRDDRRLLSRYAADPGSRERFCVQTRGRDRWDDQRRDANLDPLVAAIDAGNAPVARLLVGMLAPRSCEEAADSHGVEHAFRTAVDRALRRRDGRTVVAITEVWHAGRPAAASEWHLAQIADALLEAGLGNAALRVASAIRPHPVSGRTHPFVRAALSCEAESFDRWLPAIERAGARAYLSAAIGALANGPAIWRADPATGAVTCLGLFERLAEAGGRLSADSELIVRAIDADRSGRDPPLDAAVARRLATAFVRAGGDLKVDRGRGLEYRNGDRTADRPCNAFELAAGPPPRHCYSSLPPGARPSVFARILADGWPAERDAAERAFRLREAALLGAMSGQR